MSTTSKFYCTYYTYYGDGDGENEDSHQLVTTTLQQMNDAIKEVYDDFISEMKRDELRNIQTAYEARLAIKNFTEYGYECQSSIRFGEIHEVVSVINPPDEVVCSTGDLNKIICDTLAEKVAELVEKEANEKIKKEIKKLAANEAKRRKMYEELKKEFEK